MFRPKRDARGDTCKKLNYGTLMADISSDLAGDIGSLSNNRETASMFTFATHTIKSGMDISKLALRCGALSFEAVEQLMEQRFNEQARRNNEQKEMLGRISEMTTKSFYTLEKIRLDMTAGFENILKLIEDNEVYQRIIRIRILVEYFESERSRAVALPNDDDYVTKLEEKENILLQFSQYRSSNPGSLLSVLYETIHRGFADPKGADDLRAFKAMYALVVGTETFVSIFRFLIEAHTFIANYHFKQGNFEKYNEQFVRIKIIYRDFKESIFSNEKGILVKVIDAMSNMKRKPFINMVKNDEYKMLEYSWKYLNDFKNKLAKLYLPVLASTPKMVTVTFAEPNIATPWGRWKNGITVSYAVQHKFNNMFSKIGKWSNPIKITTKAGSYIKINDNLENKEAIVFIKIDNNQPFVVGIFNSSKTEFRDINRDLYDTILDKGRTLTFNEFSKYTDLNVDMNAKFEFGRTFLHNAAKTCVPGLIKKYPETERGVKDWRGWSHLHVAAESGCDNLYFATATTLTNEINELTRESYTPLHIAVQKGNLFSVTGILDVQNVNVSVKDVNGLQPIYYASGKDFTIIRHIVSHPTFEIEKTDFMNRSALHYAVLRKDYVMIRYLTFAKDLRKVVNLVDNNVMTALTYAAIIGDKNVVDELLKLDGIDINMSPGDKNWSPLHYSIFFKNEAVAIKLIKEPNIGINIGDENAVSPLHLAAANGMEKVVKELLNKNAEVNFFTFKEGYTPLHLAAMGNYRDIAVLLIENKADLMNESKEGKTPLDIAILYESNDVKDYLQSVSKQRYRKSYNSLLYDVENSSIHFSPNLALNPSNNKVGELGVMKNELPFTSLTTLADRKPFENLNGNVTSLPNIDRNATVLLFDLILKKLLNGKYISTENARMSEIEAAANAFHIIEMFEEELKKLEKETIGEEIDLYAMFSKIKRALMSGQSTEIPKILCAYTNNSCL